MEIRREQGQGILIVERGKRPETKKMFVDADNVSSAQIFVYWDG